MRKKNEKREEFTKTQSNNFFFKTKCTFKSVYIFLDDAFLLFNEFLF